LKNGASIGTATETSFAVTGLSVSTTYSFTVEATDAAGASAASSALNVTTVGEGPYGGTAAAIPGTVMVENYDTGGQGVGYNVTSVNGTANAYRSDGVDLEAASSPATGNNLGWSAAGQWFRYTVNVATAGTYTVTFEVAAESAIADAFHLSNSSGTNLSGSVAVPNTGGWQKWATVTATVTLPAGVQTLTLNQDAAGWNIDSMAFASSGPTTPTPTFSPVAGNYPYSGINVVISDSDAAATIYCTTDGTTPISSSSSFVYNGNGPLGISYNETLKAIAVDPALANSPLATAAYTIQAGSPTFSPVAGSYVGPETVTIENQYLGGSVVYYTVTSGTTGTPPTNKSTNSSSSTIPITVSSTETIEAYGTHGGNSQSLTTIATYTITSVPGTPTFSPASGVYTGPQLVIINEPSLNTTIYYTTDGSAPTTSSTVYNTGTAITVSSTETLNAIAVSVVTGYSSSPIGTATYTLPAIAASTTALAVTSSGSPVTSVASGSMVTLTATVASGTAKVTAGTVNFCDATAAYCTDIHLLGTAQLTSAGTATINLLPGIGSHSFNAVFVGTSSYTTSSSSTDQLTVTITGSYPTATTATGITTAYSTANGYTVAAQVVGLGNDTAAPTGTVSILDTSSANAVLGTGLLSAYGTGIAFSNPSTISFPVTENRESSVVAVGDFNGDGKPDLAVVSQYPEMSVTILLGNGDGTFTQAANSPTMLTNNPSSLAVGDFNGDGKLDLAVMTGETVTILLGNGDGTFTVRNSTASVCNSAPTPLAVADFNRDGKLDLAVACAPAFFGGNESALIILLGNGDGTFTQSNGSSTSLAGESLSFVAVGDFNGDGIPDLAVANSEDSSLNSVTIMLGNGDGTFTQTSTSPIPGGYYPNSIAVGDFRRNGTLDLAVADYYDYQIAILLGNGDGTFTSNYVADVGNGPYSVVVGDFNGDGVPDLAVANNYDETVSILLGNGNGTFSPNRPNGTIIVSTGPQELASPFGTYNSNGPESLAVGNFSGQGSSDLAVVNVGGANPNSSTLTVLQANAGEISTATITGVEPLGLGTHNVEASYGGDSNYPGNTSGTIPLMAAVVVSPNSGTSGSSVTITGNGFGSTQGTGSVTVGGITVVATAWSNTQIQTQIPNSLGIGPQSVVVTVGGQSASGTFTVIPWITGITPSSGLPGTLVSITGTNFGTETQLSFVTFNGVLASQVINWTATSIQVRAPAGITTGPVVVIVPDTSNQLFYSSNGVVFSVLATPGIASLSVTSGAVNTPVTITGTSFGTTTGTVTFNGTSATITNWTDTSIQTSVPSGATTGNVVVTAAGGASNGVPFTVAPAITSLSVTSGVVNTPVTITGTNFGTTPGTVTFNGTSATITNWTDTSIQTSVPTGATTGNVVVTAGGIASNGSSFTVLATPGIASLSVTSGAVNTPVTIAGTNFGASQGTSTVTFNGTAATVSSWSATSIAVVVPSGATTGNVVVTVSSVPSNGAAFTVLATPTISSLSVTSGAVNTPVTIAGTNFGASQGTSTVTFNGTAATVSSWSATSIAAVVPSGATRGNVVVTVSSVASNGVAFTVLATPGIASLSVTSGAVNTPVTITGTNFGASQGTSTVTFNGTAATVSSWSATSIAAVVPSGATTGNVVVTVSSVASNGVAFTVLAITLTSSANPSNYGGSVTFTATFSASGLTGPVTFMDSGTQIGTGTITGTTATYKTSSLAIGQHSITASWPGNSSYPALTSSPVLQNVQNTPAITAWPWPSAITYGQTLASSELIGGSAAVSGTFAWTAPGTIPPVGASTESVTFTPSDTTDYSSATGSVSVTVDPIESPASSTSVTYTYDNLGRVHQAQYSTSSGTITVTYSYDSAGNRTSVVTQ
jgi:hypothetical protein